MVLLKEIEIQNDESNSICEDSLNFEKYKQVLHYIIHQTSSIGNVGKTVLYKLLYFNDFNFYEMFEEKMTGESYRKIERGPAPCHFEEVVSSLQDEDKIELMTRNVGGFEQHKYMSGCKPNVSLLSGTEINFINDTISRYSSMNASQISAFSHSDIPYKATDEKDIISYELVFYRDPIFSVREYNDGDDC